MKVRTLVATLALMVSGELAAQVAFQSGNVLVSSDGIIKEYDLAGSLASQTPVPLNGVVGETPRDLVITDAGELAVFNGVFQPQLAIFDGQAWSSQTFAGWSIANNVSYGGIAALGTTILLTDMMTYNGGEARGLISFDLASGVGERWLEANDYIDVNVGLDGLIYALRNDYGALDVVDPVSFALLRSVALGHTVSSRGVAADADGSIYMASWGGYVSHYDAAGTLLKSMTIGESLQDIDLDEAGNIIVGSRFGRAYLTDTSLTSYTVIQAGSTPTFVAFVPRVELPRPMLSGVSERVGGWILTTLSWQPGVGLVDVYLNDELIDQIEGVTASYQAHKKVSQSYVVCRVGTSICSEAFVAN